MKVTNSGVKFESIDEATVSLSEAGYKIEVLSKEFFYAVKPVEISKNHPMIAGTDHPMPVAVLFEGTFLAYRFGSHAEIARHHSILHEHYSLLHEHYSNLSQ